MLPSTIIPLTLFPILVCAAIGGVYQGWHNGAYRFYRGDGSALSVWHAMSELLDFESLWAAKFPVMAAACKNVNATIENNSLDFKMPLIKLAIEKNAKDTSIDSRFILTIILLKSEGCVRVHTTTSPVGAIFHPGLVQTHEGTHSCNPTNGSIESTCPGEQIFGMIQDGAAGTAADDGLAACLNGVIGLAPANGTNASPKSEGQTYYMAAKFYNSGVIKPSGNLDNASGSTGCYCTDIANRLMGWTAANVTLASTCCLDKTCRINSTATLTKRFSGPRKW